jgi:hypothetical protein
MPSAREPGKVEEEGRGEGRAVGGGYVCRRPFRCWPRFAHPPPAFRGKVRLEQSGSAREACQHGGLRERGGAGLQRTDEGGLPGG